MLGNGAVFRTSYLGHAHLNRIGLRVLSGGGGWVFCDFLVMIVMGLCGEPAGLSLVRFDLGTSS